MVKRIFWIPMILLFICISMQSQFQTRPTLKELRALRSIRGKIPGIIVWSSLRDGTWEIYKMKADGREKVRLTNDQANNFHPVWSKNGGWIYYQRDDDIYRMRPDGSNSEIVVKDGFSFDVYEDGLSLVYVTKQQNRYAVVVQNPEKGTKEELVPKRVPKFEGKELMYPTISPDGKWLAFASDYPRTWTIHMVKMDGSDGYEFAYGCMPQYRPDGLMAAWISSGKHKVYVGTPDGESHRLFEGSIPGRPHCYYPRWSDNGKYIVFAASPHHDSNTSDYEIYIKPLGGGEAVRLTFHPRSDIWPDLFVPD